MARYDRDGNNVLDRGELTALLTELNDGNPVDPAEADSVMCAPRRELWTQRAGEVFWGCYTFHGGNIFQKFARP